MSSSGKGKRTRGRWRAALLLSASLTMASQGAVPVQAEELRKVATIDQFALATPATKQKKKDKKKKPRSIKDMIESEFGKHADEALRIAYCESKFDTDDVSSAGAVGVFQIRPQNHGWRVKKVKKGKDLFDPWTNVRVARHIFDHQGWRPWVCARIVGLSSGGSRRNHSPRSSVTTWAPNEASREPRRPRQPGGGTMTTWQ